MPTNVLYQHTPSCGDGINSVTANSLRQFDQLPDSALVSVRVVSLLLGRSQASIWRDVKSGRLAKPVRIGQRCTRWRVGDLRALMQGGDKRQLLAWVKVKTSEQMVSDET